MSRRPTKQPPPPPPQKQQQQQQHSTLPTVTQPFKFLLFRRPSVHRRLPINSQAHQLLFRLQNLLL